MRRVVYITCPPFPHPSPISFPPNLHPPVSNRTVRYDVGELCNDAEDLEEFELLESLIPLHGLPGDPNCGLAANRGPASGPSGGPSGGPLAAVCRPWATADFVPGDVVLFDLKTVHATGTNNLTAGRASRKAAAGWVAPGAAGGGGEGGGGEGGGGGGADRYCADASDAHDDAAQSFRLSVDTRWCLRPTARPGWGATPSSWFIEAAAALGNGEVV